MAQLHKKFQDSQVKELMQRYLDKTIERLNVQQMLGISARRFWQLLAKFRENSAAFTVRYIRRHETRSIDPAIERNIIRELSVDKKIIASKKTSLCSYNYSYIQRRILKQYHQRVSVPTIINRAKKNDLYIPRIPKKAAHDRQVLTNNVGELLQHDSSRHLWSPFANEEWYLITTIDDFSRFMLYATFVKKESSWTHIQALESVFLSHGLPFAYYTDSHSIFRFVRGRDRLHYEQHVETDQSIPQWKSVLIDCNVKFHHALSPQAKGKVERPYRWVQDNTIRTCARENISDITPAQTILDDEVKEYNYHRIHSTTNEIPYQRYQRAKSDDNSLFRKFALKPPFLSPKDIFCLRLDRTADGYRQISIKNTKITVNNIRPYQSVNLRIYPISTHIAEVRLWSGNKLVDVQKLNKSIFKGMHF